MEVKGTHVRNILNHKLNPTQCSDKTKALVTKYLRKAKSIFPTISNDLHETIVTKYVWKRHSEIPKITQDKAYPLRYLLICTTKNIFIMIFRTDVRSIHTLVKLSQAYARQVSICISILFSFIIYSGTIYTVW